MFLVISEYLLMISWVFDGFLWMYMCGAVIVCLLLGWSVAPDTFVEILEIISP